MISQIKFASIPVADQQRALDFYTEKLGFKVVTDQTFGEMRWIELRIGNAQTKVVLFPLQDRPPGGFLNIVFQTDDVQKTYEELKANGVEFTQEPRTESWGTSAMFRDSEGNIILVGTK
jgi:predicted enzyme related to lactoylglutathione lyase